MGGLAGGGNIQEGGAGDNHNVFSLINTTAFTDSVQTVDIMSYDSAFMFGSLIARFQTSAGSDSYYWARVRKPNATDPFVLQILKNDATGQTGLAGPVNVNISDSAYSQMTFSVQTVGTTVELEVSFTDFNGVETNLTATDASPLLGAGQVGMRTNVTSNSARFVRYDNYSAVVPEPATLALGLVGLGVMVLPRRR